MSTKRAAVVIGVNRPGGTFTPLRSPAEGAINLGIWLGKQGFDPVKVFTDKGGRYPPRDIGAFIKTIVDIQSYDQLLIYFSGHGLWKNRNEFWLLSGAPQDADAAISLEESASLAKDCGIASVILISDACRSLPKTKQQESVRGSVIFPNEEIQRQYRPKIDRFLAAVETDPAYEIPIDGKVESVFTYCLRQAYRNPDAGMVRKITEDGTEISIVPNSKLETYLRRRIAEVFASANLRLEQTPDIAVLSGDEVYIGRLEPEPAISASPEPSGLAPPPGRLVGWIESLQSLLPGFGPSDLHAPPSFTATPPAPRAHISEVADVALAKALGLDPAVAADRLAQIESLSKSSGFDQALTTEGRVPDVTHFETETGFTVAGAIVDSVRVTKGARSRF